jgi:hypothetical protein
LAGWVLGLHEISACHSSCLNLVVHSVLAVLSTRLADDGVALPVVSLKRCVRGQGHGLVLEVLVVQLGLETVHSVLSVHSLAHVCVLSPSVSFLRPSVVVPEGGPSVVSLILRQLTGR